VRNAPAELAACLEWRAMVLWPLTHLMLVLYSFF
jgi:hypothetical protein